ncbi:MAG: DNA-processing protein DprA [Gemmatimonadota bacterium]|nr:DNA-processing protein DprA [Gemmatimonadota bacterium]MDE2863739.1 DNA-processing protein DprA [Gemmatimonadota bacterium]
MSEARQMIDALTLRGLPGVGPMRFRALVDHFGSPAAALDASAAEIAAVPEVSPGTPARSLARTLELGAEGTAARSDAVRNAREVQERCASGGIAAIVYGTAGYPARLRHLKDPPPVLFALGRTRLLQRRCAAIVGSRRATAYGRRVARGLGASWAGRGRCVVSGMAMGIDAEAHRGALPGPTAAVLGSGVDVVSPPRNRTLYRKIVECGVVVSEFAPGVRAEPHHFPRRNRIIAALARDVIIVEASRRSGALITAEIALDLGREVLAVPGPIDRPNSEGTNRLIADGATIVVETAPDDVMQYTVPLPEEPDLRQLLSALPASPVTVEEAARLSRRDAEEVGPLLTILEIRGHLTPTRDGRVMRTPGRGSMAVREGAA